jgi:hypothetical protein
MPASAALPCAAWPLPPPPFFTHFLEKLSMHLVHPTFCSISCFPRSCKHIFVVRLPRNLSRNVNNNQKRIQRRHAVQVQRQRHACCHSVRRVPDVPPRSLLKLAIHSASSAPTINVKKVCVLSFAFSACRCRFEDCSITSTPQ